MSGPRSPGGRPDCKGLPQLANPCKPRKRHAKSTHFTRNSAQKRVSRGNSEQPVCAQRNFSRGLCAQRGGLSGLPFRASQPCKQTFPQIRNPLSEHCGPHRNPESRHLPLQSFESLVPSPSVPSPSAPTPHSLFPASAPPPAASGSTAARLPCPPAWFQSA
jgi:hypothetical protein